jgi:hypothetical protein
LKYAALLVSLALLQVPADNVVTTPPGVISRIERFPESAT